MTSSQDVFLMFYTFITTFLTKFENKLKAKFLVEYFVIDVLLNEFIK